MIKAYFKQIASILLVFSFISVQLQWVPMAQAEMISTGKVLGFQESSYDKASLKAMMQKAEAKAILSQLGVSSAVVEARIAQLTPAELAQFNQQAELQPAGSSIIGIVIFVAVALAVTDLVGLTDVYPFIDSVN